MKLKRISVITKSLWIGALLAGIVASDAAHARRSKLQYAVQVGNRFTSWIRFQEAADTYPMNYSPELYLVAGVPNTFEVYGVFGMGISPNQVTTYGGGLKLWPFGTRRGSRKSKRSGFSMFVDIAAIISDPVRTESNSMGSDFTLRYGGGMRFGIGKKNRWTLDLVLQGFEFSFNDQVNSWIVSPMIGIGRFF